jgi:hypothetical protein
MSRRPRRNHSAAFKAKEALAAIKGEKTLGDVLRNGARAGGSVCNDSCLLQRRYPYASKTKLRSLSGTLSFLRRSVLLQDLLLPPEIICTRAAARVSAGCSNTWGYVMPWPSHYWEVAASECFRCMSAKSRNCAQSYAVTS